MFFGISINKSMLSSFLPPLGHIATRVFLSFLVLWRFPMLFLYLFGVTFRILNVFGTNRVREFCVIHFFPMRPQMSHSDSLCFSTICLGLSDGFTLFLGLNLYVVSFMCHLLLF